MFIFDTLQRATKICQYMYYIMLRVIRIMSIPNTKSCAIRPITIFRFSYKNAGVIRIYLDCIFSIFCNAKEFLDIINVMQIIYLRMKSSILSYLLKTTINVFL